MISPPRLAQNTHPVTSISAAENDPFPLSLIDIDLQWSTSIAGRSSFRVLVENATVNAADLQRGQTTSAQRASQLLAHIRLLGQSGVLGRNTSRGPVSSPLMACLRWRCNPVP